jgi:hypothetical protein
LEDHVSNKSGQGNRLFTGLSAVAFAIAMLIAVFSATPVAAQAKAAGISDSALQSALQRALPGVVQDHTGKGAVAIRDQGMGSGLPARSVEMSEVPQATLLESGDDHDRPLSGLSEEEYQALKALAAKRAAAGQIGSAPSSVHSAGPALKVPPQSVGLTSGFYAQSEVCCDPPDMSLAVGPTYIVQMVNNYIAVYNKSGTLHSGFPKAADKFFGLASGTYTTDPRAFYDWDSGRYFVLELTETNTSNASGSPNVGAVAWAVSKTNNPAGGWWVYSNNLQQGSGVCPDFPTLGQDDTNWGPNATKGGVYIGLNLWSGANDCKGDSFTNNVIFILPKDELYSGGAYSYWYFNGLNVGGTLVDTLQPDNVTSKTTNPSSVFWTNSYNYDWGSGACSGGCNGLVVWSESGPTAGSSPNPNNPFQFLNGVSNGPIVVGKTLSTVHNYSTPPYASGPNCKAASSPCVDTDYTFISGQVKYNAGELFGSFNTGVSGTSPAVAGPIWFDVHPVTDDNGQLTGLDEHHEDCFLCGGWASNGSAYYATLQPDPENNVLMVFDYSTDATYPSMVYTSRRVTYHDSFMNGAGTFLVTGAGTGVSGRWGDYTATSPDLSSGTVGLLWFSAQYAPTSGSWGTAIGSAEYSTAANQ